MICPACRHDHPDRAKFWLECGHRFASARPQFGTELPSGAKFCLECGHRMVAAEAAGPKAPAAPPVAADFHAKVASYTPRHEVHALAVLASDTISSVAERAPDAALGRNFLAWTPVQAALDDLERLRRI